MRSLSKAMRERRAAELRNALIFLLREYDQHIPTDCDCPKVLQAADRARAAIRDTGRDGY